MKLMDKVARGFDRWCGRIADDLERMGQRRYGPRAMSELIVFPSHDDARQAGFSGMYHPKYPHIAAWWPGAGARGITMRPFQRVTIPRDLGRLQVGDEGRLADILRKRQTVFGDEAVWFDI